MNIQVYTLAELLPLLKTNFFENSPILPISKHRAISHFHNPRAKETDKVLWLLFEGADLAAYRLVLPDTVFLGERAIRMAWLSCVYVAPAHRGKGYGQHLTSLALEAWDNRLMGNGFAPASLQMYRKMGFQNFRLSEGFRGYLRLTLTDLLPNRYAWMSWCKPLLYLVDNSVNFFQNGRLALRKKSTLAGIRIQKSQQVDHQAWLFIQSRQGNELTRRSQEDLNWLLEMPWIIAPSQDDGSSERFHFSAVDTPFEQAVVTIFYQEEIIGVLIWTHRRYHFKVPYTYFDKPKTHLIAHVIWQYLFDLKIKTFTIYHPWLVDYFENQRTPFLYSKKVKRHYIYANGLPDALRDSPLSIQDGVGDSGFT